jgi:phage portal protein BeeE
MSWWRRWLGRPLSAQDGDFWAQHHGPETWAGEHVDEHSAMQLSAYFSCTRRISQTVASLPLGVFERAPDGEKRAVTDHPLYELLHHSPNADQTAVEFWEGRVLGLCTSGNGFAEKITGARGPPCRLGAHAAGHPGAPD